MPVACCIVLGLLSCGSHCFRQKVPKRGATPPVYTATDICKGCGTCLQLLFQKAQQHALRSSAAWQRSHFDSIVTIVISMITIIIVVLAIIRITILLLLHCKMSARMSPGSCWVFGKPPVQAKFALRAAQVICRWLTPWWTTCAAPTPLDGFWGVFLNSQLYTVYR